MNTSRFHSLLTHTSEPDASDLPGIKEIINEFPFFFPAYALQAKLMKELGFIGFEKSLTIAAAYAPDRTLLNEFIHAVPVHEEVAIAEQAVSESSKQKEIIVQPQDAIPEPTHQVISIKISEPEIKAAEPVAEENHKLVSIIEQRFQEIEKHQEEQPTVIQKEETPETENADSKHAIPSAENLKPQVDEPMTFTGWLKYLSEKKTEVTGNKKIPVSTDVSAAESVPSNFEVTSTAITDPAADVSSIIDKFIANEPRISTAKAGFFNPVNAARQSVEDHEDLASPTLAQIFLMQGNKEKAIEIYRRLMLLYPEKSHFFAAQIEKIQHQ